MNWKEYQSRTAEVFREAGCNADVEAIVEGVRGEHEIDVYVTFEQYGITCTWVVECKCWNSNVPKEKVLALQAIVDDVGADRGVLISKTGFQSGAIKAARKSNITLTSLEDLVDDLKENSTKRAIETLEVSLAKTKHRVFSLSKTEKLGENSFRSSYPEGIDGKTAARYGGELCILEHGFENLKLGKQSYPYKFDNDGNKIHSTKSIEKFLEAVQNQVEICNLWLDSVQETS
jgi:uncharacterized protein YbaA (DUF1428 family)